LESWGHRWELTDNRVVDDVRLPDESSLTENEKAWVAFIRLLANISDPAPAWHRIQTLGGVLGVE